ncbi:MAG: hypothetical protein HY727_07225 [Candidatus Rokubacteria bacterium]|nr:hypothetical protein [Candidatus Rokubacteria bacterium]
MTRDWLTALLVGLLLGALIGTLGAGWAQEARLQQARMADAKERYTGLVGDFVTLGTAFRIAVPDARERAVAGADAVKRGDRR